MFAQTWQPTVVLVIAIAVGVAGPPHISRPQAAVAATGSAATRSGIGDAPGRHRTGLTGVHYAFLTRVDAPDRTVTFDLIAWYWGSAAQRACRRDGVPPTDTEWCNDYYYRDGGHRLRTVAVARDAVVLGVSQSPGRPERLTLRELATWPTRSRPFRIRISGGAITRLTEVYVP
jgi:hypothetical protein